MSIEYFLHYGLTPVDLLIFLMDNTFILGQHGQHAVDATTKIFRFLEYLIAKRFYYYFIRMPDKRQNVLSYITRQMI